MLPTVTAELRAVADPTLKFSPSGKAVASIRGAANSRKKDESGNWVDDKAVFLTVTCFDKQAEAVAESIEKGSLFTVTGRLEIDEWETKEGEKRTTVKVMANDIGLSLKWDAAKSIKMERSNQQQGDPRREQTPAPSAPSDPWATPPSQDNEPPF